MDTNRTKSLVESAITDLEAQLKAGKSDALKRLLEVSARFHSYSFRNQLLITMQRPDATRVAGFHAWRKLGRFVQKGEKGIAIIAPMVGKKRDEVEASDSQPTMYGFKVAFVFDVAQTSGEPLPEIRDVQGDPAENLDALKAFAAEQAIALEYEADLHGAQGMSCGGRVVILQGLGAAEEFATLAHELAHELLHRDKATRPASKTVREVEAEAVAFVACRAAGLEGGTTASDYIQLYDGNAETLAASLERIQHTAAVLISAFQRSEKRAAA